MPMTPTSALTNLADSRDRLMAEGPPSLTQLAAEVAMLRTALVLLAAPSPNSAMLRSWLSVVSADAAHDSPAGYAIRAAAAQLLALLDE